MVKFTAIMLKALSTALVIFLCVWIFKNRNVRTPFDETVDYYASKMKESSTRIDSLKWEAAKYLQKYSAYQYGVARHLVDTTENRVYTDYSLFDSDKAYRQYIDSCKYYYKVEPPVMDVDTLTVEYLISNIELAFDSWSKPWAHDVSFDDFCRFVLPYRLGNEELSDWRIRFKEKYESSIEDSVDVLTIRNVTLYLMRRLKEEVVYGTRLGSLYKDLITPEDMEMMHTLECKALAHYGAMALRACGIPCAMLDTHWRFTEVGHRSIFIPETGNNHHSFRLSIYDELQEMGMPKDSMASWRSWIYTYEPNESLVELRECDDFIAKRFAEPVTRTDITSTFSTTYSFSYPIPIEHQSESHLFLCRFHNWRWYPIREGRVDGDSVYFKDATIRQLYRLGYMDDDVVHTFGKMFVLMGDSRLIPFDCTGDSVTYRLNVECPPEEWMTEKDITIYRGGLAGEWEPYTAKGLLWSINEKTVEYRLFDESLRGTFKPVFHQIIVRMPKYTAFTHDLYPRPIGFLVEDTIANEGYCMSF